MANHDDLITFGLVYLSIGILIMAGVVLTTTVTVTDHDDLDGIHLGYILMSWVIWPIFFFILAIDFFQRRD